MWEKTESKATSNSRVLNESHRKVKVSTAEWQTISKKCSNKEIEKTHFAPHAVKVRILNENIENILNSENNQSLEVKVSVKHGLSNISKTFSMQFNDLSCLKEGRFVFGNSLATEII